MRSEPLDACSPLTIQGPLPELWFAVIERSEELCGFDQKVLYAQAAGAAGAIVFNNVPGAGLLTMGAMFVEPVDIPSVFVTYESGQRLLDAIELAKPAGPTARITPSSAEAAWSLLAMSLIAMVVLTCVLVTFYFVRRQHSGPSAAAALRRTAVMGTASARATAAQVRRLKSFTYRRAAQLPHDADSCSICLDDFEPGEKLKVLRCQHVFHQKCVDKWLVSRRAICPLCKADPFATEEEEAPRASNERTPLLATHRSRSGSDERAGGPTSAHSAPSAFASSSAAPLDGHEAAEAGPGGGGGQTSVGSGRHGEGGRRGGRRSRRNSRRSQRAGGEELGSMLEVAEAEDSAEVAVEIDADAAHDAVVVDIQEEAQEEAGGDADAESEGSS